MIGSRSTLPGTMMKSAVVRAPPLSATLIVPALCLIRRQPVADGAPEMAVLGHPRRRSWTLRHAVPEAPICKRCFGDRVDFRVLLLGHPTAMATDDFLSVGNLLCGLHYVASM